MFKMSKFKGQGKYENGRFYPLNHLQELVCPSLQSIISNPSLSMAFVPFLRSSVLLMCPLVLLGLWSLLLYVINCSLLYMVSPILVHKLPGGFFLAPPC